MNKTFSAEDRLFPIPLYHGTDDRVIALGQYKIIFIRNQCIRITQRLLGIFQSKLGLKGTDDLFAFNQAVRRYRQSDAEALCVVFSKCVRPLTILSKGNSLYQFGSMCLTGDFSTAERYSHSAYCGGMLCDLVYSLYLVIEKIWPGQFAPDPEMKMALDKMTELANCKPMPSILKFPEVRVEHLKLEHGGPLSSLYGTDVRDLGNYTFLYTGPLDFSA